MDPIKWMAKQFLTTTKEIINSLEIVFKVTPSITD
jgi:hypothetical protein